MSNTNVFCVDITLKECKVVYVTNSEYSSSLCGGYWHPEKA